MQVHTLKLKNVRKRRKIIGRGGKKGTYCGKGNKGQKARSGAHVDPLFEGGRSTLIDHMKKVRGFKSRTAKKAVASLEMIEKKFKNGEIINKDSLIKSGIIGKLEAKDGIKIVGGGKFTKKLTVEKNIRLSAAAKSAIEKAGGKIETGKEKK